jgi:hypothetical protein
MRTDTFQRFKLKTVFFVWHDFDLMVTCYEKNGKSLFDVITHLTLLKLPLAPEFRELHLK